MDTRDLHRQATDDLNALVDAASEGDLTRPTPCEGWTLADLLAHEIGQRLGFAAAIADGDAALSAYEPVPFTPQAWIDSSATLLDAFAGADLGARAVLRLFAQRPLPVSVLVGAQLLDAAVHAWDVAKALGRDYAPNPDVVAAVGEVALSIADDAARNEAGFFTSAVRSDGSEWERILAHLGRDPHWVPPGG